MRTTREATERTIRLAGLHLVQQEARIERQRQLIWSLEADGHVDLARDARQLLTGSAIDRSGGALISMPQPQCVH